MAGLFLGGGIAQYKKYMGQYKKSLQMPDFSVQTFKPLGELKEFRRIPKWLE